MTALIESGFGEHAYPVPSLRRIAIASAITIVLGFGGIGLWAALTPLASAVPASGAFVSAGKRKTVTLLDPGILKSLAVHEGERVVAGQTLLLLDDVQARSAVDQARAVYWGANAKAARLEAETRDERQVTMPPDLLAEAAHDPAIATLVQAERNLFASRWDTFDGNARIGARKIQELQAQEQALQIQIDTLSTRLALTQEQARGVYELLKDGYAPKFQALDMKRSIAELQGAIGDAVGRLSQAGHQVEETKLDAANYAETRRSDDANDLQQARAAIADSHARLLAAQSVLDSAKVTAPEAGIVTDIKFFTPGSSITAGQPVLDLVPIDDRLLIEAPVSPRDIEHVSVGQPVNIKLVAYKAHRVPTLEGKVVYVAADSQLDPHGDSVFLVRAELKHDALRPYPGVTVTPGMPADILVLGEKRTVLGFIISPILDGMRHGMREE